MPAVGGFVFDSSGAPSDREIRFYRRDTGALLGKARSSGVDGDPHFDKVALLLHMDGADSSTTFTDSSPTPKTVTANGNVKISTAQSKFGGTCAYFGGTGDWLSLSENSAFGFGLADFTVEAWVYITGGHGTDRGITDFRSTGGSDVGTLFIDGSAGNKLAFWYGSKLGGTGQALSLNAWYHVALSRENGVFSCYVNGVQDWTSNASVDFGASRPLGIGGSAMSGWPGAGSSPFFGYIDDVRITKGVARYTSNFAPPVARFPDFLSAAGTSLAFGEYYFATNYTGEVQVVCLDDDGAPLENDLILRTFPV